MNYYYITGTSRGIGRAIAEAILEKGENQVYGISRNHTLEHKNYHPITLDLQDLEKVQDFRFGDHPDAQKLVFINNAGILGHVTQVGNLYAEKILQSYLINMVSPTILINQFVGQYQEQPAEKMLVNTSSGAARHTIPSWSTYVSTKSGMEILFRTIQDEQQDFDHPFKIYSIAPGVVDTEMQDEIREVEPKNFREIDRFIRLKKEGKLSEPQAVGKKFAEIIDHPDQYPEALMDLRDL